MRIVFQIIITLSFLCSFTGSATESGHMQEIEKSIRERIPFRVPSVGESVSFTMNRNEHVSGKLVRISEKGVLLETPDGWEMLYHKSDMPTESKAKFYKDDYEDFIKISVVNEEHKEQERIKQEQTQKQKEAIEAKQQAEEKRKERLSRWETGLLDCKVLQVLRSGILAEDSTGTVVYITDMPTKNLVDGDELYNYKKVVKEPYSPPENYDRATASGRIMGKEKGVQYREREWKLLQVWQIGTYSYRNTLGGTSTVAHYTTSIDKAESYHEKELSKTE